MKKYFFIVFAILSVTTAQLFSSSMITNSQNLNFSNQTEERIQVCVNRFRAGSRQCTSVDAGDSRTISIAREPFNSVREISVQSFTGHQDLIQFGDRFDPRSGLTENASFSIMGEDDNIKITRN